MYKKLKWLIDIEDIDECSNGPSVCQSSSSDCVNLEGSFYCQCHPGYRSGYDNITCNGMLSIARLLI